MKTNLTRRHLSLALPSSVLLTACGGGGDILAPDTSALNPNAQQAAAADASESVTFEREKSQGVYTISEVESLLHEFLTFYNDKYRPWAALAMASDLYDVQNILSTGRKYALYQIYGGHYDCQETILTTLANERHGGDRTAALNVRLSNLYWTLNGYFPDQVVVNPDGVRKTIPYTKDEYARWAGWFINMGAENIIDIKEGRNYAMARILAFVRAHPNYQDFVNNVNDATTLHNRRLGWYNTTPTQDTVEPTQTSFLSRYYGYLKFGQERKTIPRYKLVNQRGFLGTLILGENNTTESVIFNAPTVTATKGYVEDASSLTSTVTSSLYPMEPNQTTAIDYYVNTDVDTNGPFDGMSAEDSKQMLRKLTTKAARETGHVYESYLIATYCARAIAQSAVFAIRAAAAATAFGGRYNPGFDIGQMVTYTRDAASSNPQILNLVIDNRIKIGTGLTLILMCTVAAATTSWLAAGLLDKDIKANPNDSKLVSVSRVMTSFKQIWNAGISPTSTLAAVGLTGWLTLNPAEFDSSYTKWIPASFGMVDAVSGFGDLYTVLKNNKTDAGSIALATSSIFRLASAFYAATDTVAQCTDWTAYNRFTGKYLYKPIYLATVTSAVTLLSLIIKARQI